MHVYIYGPLGNSLFSLSQNKVMVYKFNIKIIVFIFGLFSFILVCTISRCESLLCLEASVLLIKLLPLAGWALREFHVPRGTGECARAGLPLVTLTESFAFRRRALVYTAPQVMY